MIRSIENDYFSHDAATGNRAVIELVSNYPSLETCILNIQNTPVEMDRLGDVFELTYHFINYRMSSDMLPGTLFELHVRQILKETALAERSVRLNPIHNRSKTHRVEFVRKGDNLVAKKLQNDIFPEERKSIAEYDCISLHEDPRFEPLAVVWEIKMQNPVKKYASGRKWRVINAMHFSMVKRKFEPLGEYFNTDRFGYVIVVNSDFIRPDSTVQQEFIRSGGRIVGAPFTYDDFVMQAHEMAIFRGWTERFRRIPKMRREK